MKPFGSELNSVNFGRPYEFKPKEGPGPGEFEVDSSLTKSKVRIAHITNEDTRKEGYHLDGSPVRKDYVAEPG